jgi:hypothetical protein
MAIQIGGTTVISDARELQNIANLSNVNIACRAWINFNGVTPSIRASENVSSITKNGTGDYIINFITAISDSNYSVIVSSKQVANVVTLSTGYAGKPSNLTTSNVRITTAADHTTSGAYADNELINVAIFR